MSQTSRSDDSLLEERIEKIRKNNERIQRRHLEVEADKQNAAKLNALVQLSPPPDDEEPRFSHPRLPKKLDRDIYEQDDENDLIYQPRNTVRDHNRSGPSTQPFTSTKSHSFSQDDGPPPDPVYNFLADRQRDPRISPRGGQFQRGSRGGRGTSPQYRERTGPPETRGRFSRGRSRGSDGPHQHAYEMWKSERHLIDQERINRQKTAGGEWKREWDKEKVSENVDNDWASNAGQGRGSYRRDKQTMENYFVRDGGQVAAPNQLETNKDIKGILKKKRAHDAPSPLSAQDTRPAAKSPKPVRKERIVKDLGTSLQVSVKNDHAAAPLVQRVKVTPKNIAGTGRVGPRQQARMSYSSQSEDEAVHRVHPDRKFANRRQSKKYDESQGTKPKSSSNEAPSTDKEIVHIASENKETGAAKPPLPPASDSRPVNEIARPKRQRIKPVRQKGFRGPSVNTSGAESLDSDKKESSDDTKERSESGDDGWEDVTTTSGTESMSEDAAPSIKDNNLTEYTKNDSFTSDTETGREVSNFNDANENQNNSVNTPMLSEEAKGTIDSDVGEACDTNDTHSHDENQQELENHVNATNTAPLCGSSTDLSSEGDKREEERKSTVLETQQNETKNLNSPNTQAEPANFEQREVDVASAQQCSNGNDSIGDGKVDDK